MLGRTPFSEVEIEGVGTCRLPNQWQGRRLKRVCEATTVILRPWRSVAG